METPLTDFGSKIGGARKDIRGNVTRDDILKMTPEERLKLVKKDVVWPTPDYAALVKEGGYDQRAAAMVKMMRDAFPATPGFRPDATEEQRAKGCELYAGVLNAAKAITERGKTAPELGEAFRSAPEAKEFLYDAVLMPPQRVGRSPELKINAGRRFGEVIDGAFMGSYTTSSEIRSAMRSFAEGSLDRSSERMLSKNRSWPEGTSRAEVWLRNNAIATSSQGGGWAVSYCNRPVEAGSQSYAESLLKRLGFSDQIGKSYAAKEEADAAIMKIAEQHFEAKQIALKSKREKFLEKAHGKAVAPDSQLVDRVGPDLRNGANVTGEDYLQEFGMRGGEYGLWVNQHERQEVTNKGYDSFCDIAEAFGLPHESASLGGTLAIAFGARGRGGWAAATYGPDRRVINLTKPSGEGCLAHEWGHGLDHWLGTRASSLGIVERVKDGEHAAYLSNVHLKPVSASQPESPETKFIREFHTAMDTIWTNSEPMSKQEAVEGSLERRDRGLRNLMITVSNQSLRLRGNPERIGVLKPFLDSLRKPDEANELESINKAVDGVLQMPEFGSGGARRDIVTYHQWAATAVAATMEMKALPEDWTGPAKSRQTNYKKQVNGLDAERQKPYWSQPHEMFARTFEAVLQDTLAEQNRSNYFLVSCTSGDAFPQNKEREKVRQRFTPLITRLHEFLPALAPRIPAPEPESTLLFDDPSKAQKSAELDGNMSRPKLPEPITPSIAGPQMNLF